MKKCIVTVVGKDTVGIIAKVCTYLAESKINILDISQTIVQGYFNMMMVVDISEIEKDFKVICDEMEQMGIVGPHEGSKPRQVLITYAQWLEMNMQKQDIPGDA